MGMITATSSVTRHLRLKIKLPSLWQILHNHLCGRLRRSHSENMCDMTPSHIAYDCRTSAVPYRERTAAINRRLDGRGISIPRVAQHTIDHYRALAELHPGSQRVSGSTEQPSLIPGPARRVGGATCPPPQGGTRISARPTSVHLGVSVFPTANPLGRSWTRPGCYPAKSIIRSTVRPPIPHSVCRPASTWHTRSLCCCCERAAGVSGVYESLTQRP